MQSEAELRGELTRVLNRYLNGEENVDAVLAWADAAPTDVDSEMLRVDLDLVREAAAQVEAGARSEDDLRQLAWGLVRPAREG